MSYDDGVTEYTTYCTADSSEGPSTQSGCGYKYHDGSVCGEPVGSDGIFCDEHRKELDDTYNWLMGN